MALDRALAVYEYLKDRPPGGMNKHEERAFRYAWEIICHYADETIHAIADQ